MRSFRLNDQGMTLMEVVVAIALVALISLALLVTIPRSVYFAETADKIYIASTLAQRRLDLLRSFDIRDVIDSGAETDTAIDIDDDGETDFYRTTEITENYGGFSDLVKAKVSIQRLEGGSPAGDPVVFETLLSEVGG